MAQDPVLPPGAESSAWLLVLVALGCCQMLVGQRGPTRSKCGARLSSAVHLPLPPCRSGMEAEEGVPGFTSPRGPFITSSHLCANTQGTLAFLDNSLFIKAVPMGPRLGDTLTAGGLSYHQSSDVVSKEFRHPLWSWGLHRPCEDSVACVPAQHSQ